MLQYDPKCSAELATVSTHFGSEARGIGLGLDVLCSLIQSVIAAVPWCSVSTAMEPADDVGFDRKTANWKIAMHSGQMWMYWSLGLKTSWDRQLVDSRRMRRSRGQRDGAVRDLGDLSRRARATAATHTPLHEVVVAPVVLGALDRLLGEHAVVRPRGLLLGPLAFLLGLFLLLLSAVRASQGMKSTRAQSRRRGGWIGQ